MEKFTASSLHGAEATTVYIYSKAAFYFTYYLEFVWHFIFEGSDISKAASYQGNAVI